MNAVDRFRAFASEERFKGWPLVGEPELGPKIPFFGRTLNFKLRTGNGVEDYTSILRHFGWAEVFGVTAGTDEVITLCQWKPGVNQASWELPPGGIGQVASGVSLEEIQRLTETAYLRETGFGQGRFEYLGYIMIETGKYRGAGPVDHGLPAHLFLATGLECVQDARKPNPNEILETLPVPLGEFRKVLESGIFVEESANNCAYRAMIRLGHLRWV